MTAIRVAALQACCARRFAGSPRLEVRKNGAVLIGLAIGSNAKAVPMTNRSHSLTMSDLYNAARRGSTQFTRDYENSQSIRNDGRSAR